MTTTTKKALPTKREIIDYLNEQDSPLCADSDVGKSKALRLSIEYDDNTHEITGFVGTDLDDDDEPMLEEVSTFRINILGCPISWQGAVSQGSVEERIYSYPELADGDPILDDNGQPVDMKVELENALNVWVDFRAPYDLNASASIQSIEKALLDVSSPGEDNFFIYDNGEDRAPVFYYEVPGEAPRKLLQIDVQRATDILFAQELPVEILY